MPSPGISNMHVCIHLFIFKMIYPSRGLNFTMLHFKVIASSWVHIYACRYQH